MIDQKHKNKNEIEYVRLVGNERRTGDTLASVSRHWQDGKEKFLFISPHDDDVVLGAGLFIQLVRKSGPYEYLRELDFKLYQPAAYYDMFEKKHHIPFIR